MADMDLYIRGSNNGRKLWQVVGVALSFFSIMYGVSYLGQGTHYVTDPSLYILQLIPGHMRVYGAFLLVVGLVMMYQVVNFGRLRTHSAVYGFCGVSTLITSTMFESWGVTGHAHFVSPWAWFTFMIISGGMICLSPPR